MTEFHFEDPDLKNSTLEIQVVQLQRTTSQTFKGSEFEWQTKSLFKLKFGNKGNICVAVVVTVLVAQGPYRSIETA